MKHGHKISL